MDSCHPIWLGKEVKIKEADDKKRKIERSSPWEYKEV